MDVKNYQPRFPGIVPRTKISMAFRRRPSSTFLGARKSPNRKIVGLISELSLTETTSDESIHKRPIFPLLSTPKNFSDECYSLSPRLSVDCLFLRSPSRVLYRTELIPRAPKRAAYPDPPPVIPLPESRVAEVTSLPSPRSLGHICGGPRPNRLSSVPGSASGPKCFQER